MLETIEPSTFYMTFLLRPEDYFVPAQREKAEELGSKVMLRKFGHPYFEEEWDWRLDKGAYIGVLRARGV